ncbi:MAG: MerR family transcriptional regulator, partial [Acidovorax sp.]|nr:MerR family transcriptional regulator [Acidovorax sp.]
YWEQEFTQLRPMKRRGNRRYYQHHEVLMIRRIRDLLYDQGFTISGARNRLQELVLADRDASVPQEESGEEIEEGSQPLEGPLVVDAQECVLDVQAVRQELCEIRALLSFST